MKLPLTLDLPLNPTPQARPVVTFRHGRSGAHTFTPDKTRQFYRDFQTLVRAAGVRGKPYTGRVRLELRLWRHHSGRGKCGDLSNMVKACEDAMTGCLLEDDDQVVELEAVLVDHGKHVQGHIQLVMVALDIEQAG